MIENYEKFRRLTESVVYFNGADYVSSTDLSWNKILERKVVHYVDGLFETVNVFYRSGYYKYHSSDIIATTDIKSASYFTRIGKPSFTYYPKHMKYDIIYDREAPVIITTSNTPYNSISEKEDLINILVNIVTSLIEKGVDISVRIKDKDILKSLSSFELISLDEWPKRARGIVTTPSSIIFEPMKNRIPVLQVFLSSNPIFVQSGWMVFPGSFDTLRVIDSFLEPEPWRLIFQINEVMLPLEKTVDKVGIESIKEMSPYYVVKSLLKYVLRSLGLNVKQKNRFK